MRKILMILSFLAVCASTYSQDRTISGQVISGEDQSPLSGVAVIVEGSTNGTLTDMDGRWSLSAGKGSSILFTCLGYADQRVTVGNNAVYDIVMNVDATQLEELVVIGYGAVKKSDLTGSVSSLKGDELKKSSSATVGQALQGKIAGVTVVSNTGQPGSDVSIRIRGIGSVNAGVTPLYVVDGMIVGDINFLSPNDIANTEVLKDASAAAIYGSRAANGVILITTKSGGNRERTSVTFEAYAGVQQRWRKLDLLGPVEHIEKMFEINSASISSKELQAYSDGGINGWLNYARIGGTADYPVASSNSVGGDLTIPLRILTGRTRYSETR